MALTNALDLVNEPQVAEQEAALTLTAMAESKLRNLIAERNIPNHGLRVFVAGGGCNGLQYGMAFEAQSREFDSVIEQGGVKMFVDPTSLMYLSGASIDYIENEAGGGFKIDNPNATASSCGCGSSSSAEGDSCGCGGGSCGCSH